ncbi:BACON domain-containing protein (plasmid) [Streptomyces sp. CWNU-52B]|uniref:BACON domain-containing protein n=1 Tax=unclassified Streptomyces TaxID=2593676 RepID=UPI0039C1B58B
MMSSSPETSTRTTGAHRAHREARDRAAARTLARRPSNRYEPYLDGLFTYCLSVLCDHDTATAALGDALALAERRGQRGPEKPDDRRAWLYALARWSCLRKLAEAKQKRHGSHGSGTAHAARPTARPVDGTAGRTAARPVDRPADRLTDRAAGRSAGPLADEAHRRRRELALLAWPEAAGTTPEQREALELAVRHQLAAHEVAAVLGTAPGAARELLAAAACEVERTRAALAVVETGTCPGVARLTGDNHLVLGTALRHELVRHVDDCPRCRRTAERAVPGSWPGTSVTPAALPVLEAPRTALHMAMAHVPRGRGGGPHFDRRGFPMDPKDHAARRDRLRARAVTTTVVATVVAAPVLALWAAYRGAPLLGEGADGRPATATEAQGSEEPGSGAAGYENAGNASTRPGARFTPRSGSSDVSVEVVSVTPGQQRGGLSVAAGSRGDTTLITLTATGGSPVRWSASTGVSWLYLSQSAGTLAPGESLTVKVYVDHLREPIGAWSARVSVAPAGAVVTIDGYGTAGPSRPGPRPDPPAPTPRPSGSAGPSEPGPSHPGPGPSDPGPSDPGPGPSEPGPSDPGPGPTSPGPGPGPSDPEPDPPPAPTGGEPSPSGS